jgi:hypothetical protein
MSHAARMARPGLSNDATQCLDDESAHENRDRDD